MKDIFDACPCPGEFIIEDCSAVGVHCGAGSIEAGASWTLLLLRHRDEFPCGYVVVSWLIILTDSLGVESLGLCDNS